MYIKKLHSAICGDAHLQFHAQGSRDKSPWFDPRSAAGSTYRVPR